jgi:hypothetical protein
MINSIVYSAKIDKGLSEFLSDLDIASSKFDVCTCRSSSRPDFLRLLLATPQKRVQAMVANHQDRVDKNHVHMQHHLEEQALNFAEVIAMLHSNREMLQQIVRERPEAVRRAMVEGQNVTNNFLFKKKSLLKL